MNVTEQIEQHIASQAEPKRSELQTLHEIILQASPGCQLWFFDGTDSEGKMVANPTIGYGSHTIKYVKGDTRAFFKMGLSGNKTGISIHIMGINDKTYLAQTFGKELGKAKVTGYCINFKTLKDINMDVLEAAIRFGMEPQD